VAALDQSYTAVTLFRRKAAVRIGFTLEFRLQAGTSSGRDGIRV
jgi:hypothetical protein